MSNYLMTKNSGEITNVDGLKKIFRFYMGYFLDNPHIYRFFYFHSLDKDEKREKSFDETSEFAEQMKHTFAFLSHSGQYSQSEIVQIGQIIIYSMQGLLTMAITDNDSLKVEIAYKQLYKMIDFLLSTKN